MIVPPPARFSTTTGWPKNSESFGAMTRAEKSVPPPGDVGTIRRTGLVGYAPAPGVCARAEPHATSMHRARQNAEPVLTMLLCLRPVLSYRHMFHAGNFADVFKHA